MSVKLHAKQLKAVRLMVYGRSSAEIGRQLGLHPRTLSRWKENPEFIKEYKKVLKEQQENLRYRMTHLAAASIEVLWSELQGDPVFSQRVKVALNLIKLFITPELMEQMRLVMPESSDGPSLPGGAIVTLSESEGLHDLRFHSGPQFSNPVIP